MEAGGGHDHHQSLGHGGARWNPTKEQINMLEGLYKQGLRTPSAEQIQQITNRLKEFGHIEGKNVFYWFQNHKARQRQKQKQETSAYFGRLYHSTASPFAPYPNVVCTPCHIPPPTQADLAMYHQHQHTKVQLPPAAAGGCFKRRLISPEPTSQRCNHMMQNPTSNMNKSEQETLELFPMHPTGILQGKTEKNVHQSSMNPAGTSRTDRWILGDGQKEAGKNDDQPFYDFFSGKLN